MKLVPVFPLPNVVFFPKTTLPLHVFEPRYRQMVVDALRGERLIAMALLKPGWEKDYLGRPEIHTVGSLGKIVDHEELRDHRHNILLEGIGRVRLLEAPELGEEALAQGPSQAVPAQSKLYRRAWAAPLPETQPDLPATQDANLPARLVELFEQLRKEAGVGLQLPALSADLSEEELINLLAGFLDLPVDSKQDLLEQNDLLARAEMLEGIMREQVLYWGHLRRFKPPSSEDPRLN